MEADSRNIDFASPESRRAERPPAVSPMAVGLGLCAVVALAVAAYLYWPRERPVPPPVAAPAVQAPPAAPAAPAGPRHPVPAAVEPVALPRLGESDATMIEALSSLAGRDTVANFVLAEDLVRRIVATIDNLPRESYASRLNPIRTPGGPVKVTGREASLALSPDNAARYAPFVRALEAVDTARLAAIYQRLYPLFQEAYVGLGYPNGHFNDRLVEVIDHLLQAPELTGPVKLTVPHVLYEYADPELEARSGGQKVLMRMGAANAKRVKAKLREIRAHVAR